MAAELVGTAYVRIKAITAGLASDIKDGVDKGVADADLDKAGKTLGGDLGDTTSEAFGKKLGDGGIADGLADAFDAPEVHKASEDGGKGVAKDVSKGVDDETKRHNPFKVLGDRLASLDLSKALTPQLEDLGKTFDKDLSKAFDKLGLDIDLDFGGPRLQREAEEAGKKTAQSTKKGFDDENKKHSPFESFSKALKNLPFTSKPFNWIGIFGPATLAPIIGTITSLLGLVVQSLGFIVTAAAGAGAAIAGIAAVALPGLGVLFAAFKVQTKQLERFKKRAKELLKPWEQIGAATQEFLLPGIENLLEAIQLLIPQFVEFGTEIGRIFGDMATFAGEIFTSEKNMRALGKILDASEEFFTNIRTAALKLADLLLPFLEQVAPLAVAFSESVKDWATNLHDAMSEEGRMEALGETLKTWYDRFVLLIGVIGDVFAGLWGILDIAGETSTPFFEKIAEAAQRFRDWVASAEGQNKIRDFFEKIQPVLDEVWRLLGNVFDLIIQPAVEGDGGAVMFERLATALDLLNDVLENPVTKEVVPYLLGLFVGVQLLSTAGKTAEAIDKFSKSMSKLSDMIKKIPDIPANFMNFMTTGTFGAVATPMIAVAIAAGLVYLAFQNWDTIVDFIQPAIDVFEDLAWPLQVVATYLGTILLALNPIAWAIAIAGFLKNWDEIWAKIKEIGEAIKEFVGFEHLKEMFQDFVDAIPGILQSALDSVTQFVTDLPSRLSEIGAKIAEVAAALPAQLAPLGEALLEFVTGIPDQLAGLGDKIGEFFSNLDVLGKLKDALLAGIEALPGLLLDAAGLWQDLGGKLLDKIKEGIRIALPALVEFGVGLPGRLIRAITAVLPTVLSIGSEIIGFIVKGLATAVPRLLFFFLGLPFRILTILRKAIVALIKLGAEMIAALFKGLWDNKGEIFDFFKELPGNLIRGLIDGIGFLLGLGKDLIIAVFNGVKDNAGALFDFFKSLPSLLLEQLGNLGGILLEAGGNLLEGLLEGAKSFLGVLNEFFAGLPQMIVDFIVASYQLIVDLGGKIPGWIVDGATALASTLWDWFTALPGLIVETLTGISQSFLDIGGDILGWIKDGIVAVAQTLWDWFLDLPQTIWDTLNSIVSQIWDIGTNLILEVIVGIYEAEQDIIDWFKALPGNIWDWLYEVVSDIWDIGKNLILEIIVGIYEGEVAIFDWVKALPGNIWGTLLTVKDEVVDIGKDLVGWIIDGLIGLPDMLWEAFKTAWNWAIDQLSFEWEIPIPPHPTIGFDGSFLKLATGGIIPGTQFGMQIVAGEGFRAEAVVPMTRPTRALAVMHEAGLDKLVLDAYINGGGASRGQTATGDTTMLHIDNAVMMAPVDADLVVQKVTSAYNRLAS